MDRLQVLDRCTTPDVEESVSRTEVASTSALALDKVGLGVLDGDALAKRLASVGASYAASKEFMHRFAGMNRHRAAVLRVRAVRT